MNDPVIEMDKLFPECGGLYKSYTRSYNLKLFLSKLNSKIKFPYVNHDIFTFITHFYSLLLTIIYDWMPLTSSAPFDFSSTLML